jgi:hypothetical protein
MYNDNANINIIMRNYKHIISILMDIILQSKGDYYNWQNASNLVWGFFYSNEQTGNHSERNIKIFLN